MRVSRNNIQTCCGGTTLLLKSDVAITAEFIAFLVSHNYKEHTMYSKSGLMYVTTPNLILSGSLGSTNISVRCKTKNCGNFIDEFETLVTDWQ